MLVEQDVLGCVKAGTYLAVLWRLLILLPACIFQGLSCARATLVSPRAGCTTLAAKSPCRPGKDALQLQILLVHAG